MNSDLLSQCIALPPFSPSRSVPPGMPLWIENTGLHRDWPGHYFAANRDQWVLHLCLAGRGYVRTRGKVTGVDSPCILALSPGEYHEHWSDRDDPWTLFHWYLRNDGDLTTRALQELGLDREVNPLQAGTAEEERACGQLAGLTGAGSEAPGVLYEQYQYMVGFHALLSRMLKRPPARYRTDTLAAQAERYLLHIEDAELNVNSLAARLGVSRSTLTRAFRSAGLPAPGEVIITRRILRAKEMLESNPRIKLRQLAAGCGYTDPAYFCRLFTARIGEPPLTYARRKSDG